MISVPDEKLGEVPLAFVELKNIKDKSAALQKEIIDFAAKYLQVWQRPMNIEIMDALPLGLTGKIDRGLLKKEWLK